MNNGTESKYIKLILFSLIVFSLSLHLPALFRDHIENDEVIYQTLAEKLSRNPLDYTLQGTYIVNQLPETHNSPLFFFHPPLFCLLLAFVKILFGIRMEILVPILSAALTVWLVFLIAKRLYNEKVALLAAAINALCPVSLHASTKIWMDSTLALFVTASVYIALIASKKERIIYYVFLGIVLAAAIMTKLTGFIIFPLILFILWYKNATKKKILYALFAAVLTIILISPWFYLVHSVFGTISFWWLKKNPQLLEMFPFAKMITERPVHFYISNLMLVAPIYMFSLAAMIEALKRRKGATELAWSLLFIGVFTYSGYVNNFGYITRYILPCLPALAILGAEFMVRKNKIILYGIAIFFLGYGFFVGILNSYIFQVADIFPLEYFFKAMSY
ncbi:MAG: glycosyltransferase family 39 protein [Candidatus Omnitrophica bacterium]|nr:glycosyltransferase family 39 protein [Candidatus Omnitrophota bacterium]